MRRLGRCAVNTYSEMHRAEGQAFVADELPNLERIGRVSR
jgi:hypothetical protein